MTTSKTDKKPMAEKTEKPASTRLSHAQWHQVATYVAGCVDPDTDHLSCTPSELVHLVRQDTEQMTNPGQLREMCKQLGLTIRLDKPAAADVHALAAQVLALTAQLGDLHKEVGALIDINNAMMETDKKAGDDIVKIKDVLNQHARQLSLGGDN